ncbi:Mitotic exit network component, variant 2 [Basidiobolus ranarum]|uniref:Mitotic exit network component, variant 2 n=1 Tax=Basidiobolus ranarum TaxID=34480 RepID=A0ABR2WZM8_9FUNG
MSTLDLTSLKKLKVADLKELLTKEGLSVAGKKEDLLARISEHYKIKGSHEDEELPDLAPPENFDWNEAGLSNDADLPPELRGDTNDAEASENTEVQLPEELIKSDTPAKEESDVPPTDSLEQPISEVKVDEEKVEEKVVEDNSVNAKAEEAIVAAELEKRRQRALRFGIPLSDSTKVVERSMKFGTTTSEGDAAKVSSLDLPLGERKGNRGRGGKPGNTVLRNNVQIEPETLKKRQERFGVVNKKLASQVPLDPEEEERRRKRAERFGDALQVRKTRLMYLKQYSK